GYQLYAGPIPVITSVFPLGVPRGAVSEVRVEGVNLGKERSVKVSLGADAVPGARVPIKVGSAETSVLVGEFPEVRAGMPVPTPGTANGVIALPGASEAWSFAAKKGRRVILEVNAARIGSPLDSTIEVLDEAGRPLPRAVLRSLARTYTVFRDNDSASPGIRIETWGELAVNDLLLIDNELLKIRALPRNPDDDCQFFQDGGRRAGYLGTTPTYHSVGTPMYKVGVHPPGTTFPPNGLPLVTLFWRNDDGGAAAGKDSRLAFDPPADGTYRVRVTDARGEGGPAHAYRLTVREPRPDFSVSLSPASPTVFPGGATPVQVNVSRTDEFDGTIDVEVKNLPAGLTAPRTNVGPDDTATSVALFADAGFKLPVKTTPIELVARAVVNGKEVVRTAAGGVPAVGKSADILTTTQEPEAALKPGGEAKVTVTIERRNGFAGRVPLDVRGLPHGVRVLDVGLNGILIIPGETRRTFVLYAEPWVKPMEHPVVVFARREGKAEEYAARSVLLRVK
ncbi:MAG: c-type cytochrome domain-containing protein, partial [Gemmataceae bacterium]